jgi:hypothetical protein
VREFVKEFLTGFFHTTYALWVAPKEQAFDLLAAFLEPVLTLFIVFLTLRWMWRKLK